MVPEKEVSQSLALGDRAVESIQKKLSSGKSLSAADLKFIQEHDARARVDGDGEPLSMEEPPGPDALDADGSCESWLLREGVVGGVQLSQDGLSAALGEPPGQLCQRLRKVQRRLLKRYGFDEGKSANAELTGSETQAFELVKTLESLRRIGAESELQLDGLKARRERGEKVPASEVRELAELVVKLTKQRDALVLKLKSLAQQERRDIARTGNSQLPITIVINNSPLGGGRDGKE